MARSTKVSSTRRSTAVTLDGFYGHFSIEDCIAFVAVALERAGLATGDLLSHQRNLLQDLESPLDEEAMATMLAWWEYDAERLMKRSKHYEQRPAKPQIDVWIEITSKGNLKAEWFPRGITAHSLQEAGGATDFPCWKRYEKRGIAYNTRPSNELFFIHAVQPAINNVTHDRWAAATAVLDHVLLAACERIVERLKDRLAYHFDVRMKTDVFLEWIEFDNPRDRFFEPPLVRSWVLDDPAERIRLAELEELARLEGTLGCSEATLIQAREAESERRGRSGPPPSSHTIADRLAKRLKAEGLPATKGKVERALSLIDRHRAPSNVVPLRS